MGQAKFSCRHSRWARRLLIALSSQLIWSKTFRTIWKVRIAALKWGLSDPVCQGCNGTHRCWQISLTYLNQEGQIMPTTSLLAPHIFGPSAASVSEGCGVIKVYRQSCTPQEARGKRNIIFFSWLWQSSQVWVACKIGIHERDSGLTLGKRSESEKTWLFSLSYGQVILLCSLCIFNHFRNALIFHTYFGRTVTFGTIHILRHQKEWVGGSRNFRKWPVLLMYRTVFTIVGGSEKLGWCNVWMVPYLACLVVNTRREKWTVANIVIFVH